MMLENSLETQPEPEPGPAALYEAFILPFCNWRFYF